MRCICSAALFASLAVSSSVAIAGPYTDDFSKCLVAATTDQDKGQLVEWMFFSLALNPRISPYAQISPEQRDTANRKMAKIFDHLVTEACNEQAKQAVKYEGTAAISESFKLLGQVAAQEIVKDPAVAAGNAKFAEYLDENRLSEALDLPSPAE